MAAFEDADEADEITIEEIVIESIIEAIHEAAERVDEEADEITIEEIVIDSIIDKIAGGEAAHDNTAGERVDEEADEITIAHSCEMTNSSPASFISWI